MEVAGYKLNLNPIRIVEKKDGLYDGDMSFDKSDDCLYEYKKKKWVRVQVYPSNPSKNISRKDKIKNLQL
jgi:hypothetical protein